MTSSDLRPLLKHNYVPANWKRILNALFPNREFLGRPIKKELFTTDQQEIANEISVFGEVRLTDTSLIGFYAVELKSGKSVSKSRVGLRNLIDKDVIPGNLDGILAVYFSADSPEWRMSFISKSATWDEEGKMIKEETQPRRYTYVFGPQESCETAIERFQVLFANVAAGLKIDHLLQAFSVEKISTEFFDKYCHHYETLTEYLEQSTYRALFEAYFADEPDPDHHAKLTNRAISNFVKKFMGRLVFLYFLQKKGWLGNPRPLPGKAPEWGLGDRNFIKNLFADFPEPTQFYSLCLTQLFFGALNTPRPNDIFEIHPLGGRGLVPYLNGGLFEKDAFEPININFKTEDLKNLFDFFDSYNFTIDENHPTDQDVGVDPEMLGLIFENLLEDNKDKGTFYTPKEVVHFMCRESLSVYLQQKLHSTLSPVELRNVAAFVKGERSSIPSVVTTHADVIYQTLDEVRICDPAIGSGAFPMGMVLELFDLKRKLSGLRSKPKAFLPHAEKLRIIRENIYGVDLDKGAVDIARLRFWLSLIVDEQAPAPLPNLDYKIMQGDSLVESFEGIPLDNVLTTQKTTVIVEGKQLGLFGDSGGMQTRLEFSDDDRNSLKDLVGNYFDPALTDKKEVRQRIDGIIHDNIEYNFELIQKQNSRFIGEKQHDLALIPPDSDKDSPAKRKQKTKAREKLQRELDHWLREEEKLLAKRDKLFALEHKDEKPYFLWHLFFNDILTGRADAGFDIVIGNPPYGVKISEDLTQHYGIGSKDSYGAFMSMALRKLLKPGGILCYIVSDTWLTIKTHLPLRTMMLEHQLHKVIRLHQDCFKAVVNSCIFTLSKASLPGSGRTVSANEVIAADLTYISTRKDIPQFRELIFNLETFVGEVTPNYAVYTYPQALINTNSHKPIFVASPKLFTLMNDTTAPIDTITPDPEKPEEKITSRKIEMNSQTRSVVKFGEIAEVKQGLATGDNDYYLYQNPDARGNYKNIRDYAQYLLTDTDLEKIRNDENLRLSIIEKGIH